MGPLEPPWEDKRTPTDTLRSASQSLGLRMALGWLCPAFALAVPSGSPPECYIENAGIPGEISRVRARIRPKASLSILNPPSAVFFGCGVAAPGRRRVSRPFPGTVPPCLNSSRRNGSRLCHLGTLSGRRTVSGKAGTTGPARCSAGAARCRHVGPGWRTGRVTAGAGCPAGRIGAANRAEKHDGTINRVTPAMSRLMASWRGKTVRYHLSRRDRQTAPPHSCSTAKLSASSPSSLWSFARDR